MTSSLQSHWDGRLDVALVAVREFIADDGMEAAQGLALIRHESDESGGVIAVDAELAALALRDAPARSVADERGVPVTVPAAAWRVRGSEIGC